MKGMNVFLHSSLSRSLRRDIEKQKDYLSFVSASM